VRTGKDSTAANLIVEFFRKSTCKLLSFQDQSWPVCSRNTAADVCVKNNSPCM
jgi:hypothetical protein